jgi:hypothetical protein
VPIGKECCSAENREKKNNSKEILISCRSFLVIREERGRSNREIECFSELAYSFKIVRHSCGPLACDDCEDV